MLFIIMFLTNKNVHWFFGQKIIIIITQWIPSGQIVNQYYYKEVLIKSREQESIGSMEEWLDSLSSQRSSLYCYLRSTYFNWKNVYISTPLASPLTHHISFLVISTYSQKLKLHWKKPIIKQLMMYKWKHQDI